MPIGRAAAKGRQPRAAARHMVTNKPGRFLDISSFIFFHFFLVAASANLPVGRVAAAATRNFQKKYLIILKFLKKNCSKKVSKTTCGCRNSKKMKKE